jgi:hypothetical protein
MSRQWFDRLTRALAKEFRKAGDGNEMEDDIALPAFLEPVLGSFAVAQFLARCASKGRTLLRIAGPSGT